MDEARFERSAGFTTMRDDLSTLIAALAAEVSRYART